MPTFLKAAGVTHYYYKLLLDCLGKDLAGHGDIHGVLLVTPTLGHVLIFSSLYCWRFVNVHKVKNPALPHEVLLKKKPFCPSIPSL